MGTVMAPVIGTSSCIVMNPRSGGGTVARRRLVEEAKRRGAQVHLLEPSGPGVAELLNAAVDAGAAVVGVAGGDGTIAAAAAVAADRGIPLLVVPAGTRNHFAMDLGLDRERPERALDALVDGVEVTTDLGAAGERTFVNNVSVGAYADLIRRRDYRDHKLLVAVAALPELVVGREAPHFQVRVDDATVVDPAVALISNNAYATGGPGRLARRERLNAGVVGLLCIFRPPAPPTPGASPTQPPVTARTATAVVLTSQEAVLPVAIDGEAVDLHTPVTCRVRPGALRVLVPRAVAAAGTGQADRAPGRAGARPP